MTARVYRGTDRNLSFLARRLRAGELVAVPSETVYGLAANALDARACRRIFAAKGRPRTDPLIVHIHSLRQLAEVAVPNPAALRLARKFWPGPLTLVLPKRPVVPAEVTAGLPSVAVRMPSHPLFRRLLQRCGLPLAAPSANAFGYVSPTTAAHVHHGLGKKIRHILDGGATPIGLESTIVDLRDPAHPRLLRPGAITRAQLNRALGTRLGAKTTVGRESEAQVAPGSLKRHYSPHAQVVLHPRLAQRAIAGGAPDEAWLFLKRPAGGKRRNVFWLDRSGTHAAVARRLFAQLRELDHAGFSVIHVELARGTGLAEAINDRLRRAAAQ
ncbi:MAG: threonylcarbamoyl-AMP synthase [Opitutaceae bacterium]|nr:threonylcarbamoyl-AMP synthase [Opitutaceae bacterium]